MHTPQLGDSTFYWIAADDLILSGQFAWEGAVALATQEDAGCVASHRYPILRGRPGLAESAYLFAFFTTAVGHMLLDHHSRGAAGRNRPLNVRSLLREKLPIPPLHVQQEIVDIVHLERQLTRAVALQETALQEYRTRLIADVVTGKLDVREAARHLPDEPDDLDEADDLPLDELSGEEDDLAELAEEPDAD